MVDILEKDKQRFNSKIIKKGDCLLWQGALDKDGYGNFYFKKKNRRVHRVAMYFAKGPIEDGLVVDHICKNRNCVAINHLRLITARQNTLENSNSVGARNSMKVFCKNGHRFDKVYGEGAKRQRYCSVCQSEKSKRLKIKWREEANTVKC